MKARAETWVDADLVITGAGELLACRSGNAGTGAGSRAWG